MKHYTPADKVVSNVVGNYFESQGGIKDDDLYFVNSVLVTSNWNLNDDVFGKFPTWSARNTPTHKPTNIGHDHNQIVGHIVNNWPIDTEGNLIPDNSVLDDIPDVFHIITGSVIYRAWKETELQQRVEALIQDIEGGNKYVSMECLFSNFGYAVVSPDGKYYTLARDEKTSFLTKHLRAYGGKGQYEGYKVGRYLDSIVFSAHGYVEEPANPESIIFDKEHVFSFSLASQKNPFVDNSGVSIPYRDVNTFADKQESSDMSDQFYQEQAKKLEEKVIDLTTKLEVVQVEHTKAGVDTLKSQITDLTSKVETLTTERDKLVEANTTLETTKSELETKVEETTIARDEYKSKVEEAEAAATKAFRISELVESGAAIEEATTKVEAFVSLTDEQWAVVASTLKEAYAVFPPKDDKDDKEKDKKDKKKDKSEGVAGESDKDDPSKSDDEDDSASANADDADLDKVESDADPVLAAAAQKENELNAVRKELRTAVATRLGKTLSEDDSEGDD